MYSIYMHMTYVTHTAATAAKGKLGMLSGCQDYTRTRQERPGRGSPLSLPRSEPERRCCVSMVTAKGRVAEAKGQRGRGVSRWAIAVGLGEPR